MTNSDKAIEIENVLKVYKGDTDVYALNDVYNDILHALSALGSFITTIFYTLVLSS